MAGGEVIFKIQGPGILVGDNPFILEESGGAGAVWIKTGPQAHGIIYLKATHSSFGAKNIKINVLPAVPIQGIST
jgi:beta-galactosidase